MQAQRRLAVRRGPQAPQRSGSLKATIACQLQALVRRLLSHPGRTIVAAECVRCVPLQTPSSKMESVMPIMTARGQRQCPVFQLLTGVWDVWSVILGP